ncbi:MAG: glycosyltransferase family 39 protein [Pseudomonadales bacterium]|jgi:uncharacterized membrane protein|nr:glycosyltransferase family 39 protein [Pseudomonadales bacterium]
MSKLKEWFSKYWILILIVVAAFVLRLPHLNGSLWLDEAAQALQSARPFSQQHLIASDFQPPFLHYLLHFMMYFGQSEAWMRLWGAVLPGLLAIIFSYLVAEKLFGRKVAILTSVWLAISSFHVFFSQELRPYMWSGAWSAISSYFLLKVAIWDKKPNRKNLAGFIIATILGLHSSYLYPFVFASHLLILLWRKKWHQFGWSLGLTILGFLPWLPFFLGQLQVGTNLDNYMPGWQAVVSFGPIRAIVMTIAKFIFGVSDLEIDPYYVTTTLAFAGLWIGAVYFNFKTVVKKSKQSLIPLLILLIAPFLTAWIVSFIVPVIQPKRVIFLMPWFYMLIIIFIAPKLSFAKVKLQNLVAILLTILILIINIFSYYEYMTNPLMQRENWRALYHEVYYRENIYDTVILSSYLEPFSPWRWYDKHNDGFVIPSIVTQTFHIPTSTTWQENISEVTNFGTILVFDYLKDLTDPERQLNAHLLELGYVEVDYYDYPNIGFVRVFRRQAEPLYLD